MATLAATSAPTATTAPAHATTLTTLRLLLPTHPPQIDAASRLPSYSNDPPRHGMGYNVGWKIPEEKGPHETSTSQSMTCGALPWRVE